jgi:hypothetical protein
MDEKHGVGLPNQGDEPRERRSGKQGGDSGGEGPDSGSLGFENFVSESTGDPLAPDGSPVVDGEDLIEGEVDLSFFGSEDVDESESAHQREVREFFTVFVKTIRAAHLYVQGNPLLHRFFDDLGQRLHKMWEGFESLSFTIHESEISWQNRPVYQGRPGGQDNLAFQLYKDGIRRIEFQPGVETDEMRRFIDVLRLSRTLRGDEEDLLTLMWNEDFEFIRYEYVDVLGEEPPLPEGGIDAVEMDADLPMLPELELSPELQSPALREDFEPSLYFLGEEEVAALQRELEREWQRPVRRDVMLAVLDQYEMGDDERRGEIATILGQMLPRFLAEGEFGDAAFIVSELRGVGEKRDDPEVQGQVDKIVAELSEPMVVDQLVRVMDDGSVDPKGDELATLLSALKPQAIEVLIRALPTMTRVDAREQLGATLDRLASMNPGLMAEFIRSEDPRVAAETARIAARLKMVDVSDAIASLLDRPSSEVRLAAVESLVALRSSKAGNPLVKALRDEGRDVRIAAARGLAELKYGPAAQDLESLVRSKDLLRRDLTEQLAVFEAYAVAAGEKGTKLLARLLNGRRFFWIKYPSRMRACAARALGLVGGEEARAALSIAERSRDPMVLSAVHATRRRPDTETDDAER